MTDQFSFVFQAQPTSRSAAGNNKSFRLEPFVVRFHADVAILWIKFGDFGVGKTGSEFLGLLVHVHDQLRAFNPFRESRKILDQSSGGELAARLPAFEHERTEL